MVVAATAVSPAPAAPEELTWVEANKRSAALIRERGHTAEAAALARMAFDAYPRQAKTYNARIHAQLLLNLVDARNRVETAKAARAELESGIEAIEQRTGPRDPVLVDLWRQGSALQSPGSENYFKKAVSVAEQAWGPGDPRTIRLLLSMTHDLRASGGYFWARGKFRMARERAQAAGTDAALVAETDLMLAKIEMESGNVGRAIEEYEALIGRLEQGAKGDQAETLALAYALLEYAYEEKQSPAAAAEVRRKRALLRAADGEKLAGKLMPVLRVAPVYPERALGQGREGYVEFLMDIKADGTVANLKVLRSEPPGLFDESASEAVKQWKFEPRIVDGQPVASSGTQRIEYRLKDSGTNLRRGSN